MEDKCRISQHSAGWMAGAFAAAVGAQQLVLTHFSARYHTVGFDQVNCDVVARRLLGVWSRPVWPGVRGFQAAKAGALPLTLPGVPPPACLTTHPLPPDSEVTLPSTTPCAGTLRARRRRRWRQAGPWVHAAEADRAGAHR